MNRALLLVVVCGVVGSMPGCSKHQPETNPQSGRVSVQRPTNGAGQRSDWADAVYPARYADPVLPVFPAEAIAAEVAHATVRVDFTVLVDGRAHDLRLELAEPVPEGPRFLEACRQALERWRFSPAWRLKREAEQIDDAVVLVPSRAHLIFRFDLASHLDGTDVELEFGPGDS